MKFTTSLIIASALAVLSVPSHTAEAAPLEAQNVEGHLHLLARAPDAEIGMHRRHHAKQNSKRACNPNKYSGSSSSSSSSSNKNSNGQVQQKVQVSVTQTTTVAKSQATGSSYSSGSSSNGASTSSGSSNLPAFKGQQSNAILSWFKTNSGQDSTNGQSWCQTKYQDDWVCGAISVGTMLNAYGGDYNKAASAFCGAEMVITNPSNGKSITAFVCDGFDDKWVKTPASVDLTLGAFDAIYQDPNGNKNIVVTGATWHFTGNTVAKGTFKSS